jgi:hypothetical protein
VERDGGKTGPCCNSGHLEATGRRCPEWVVSATEEWGRCGLPLDESRERSRGAAGVVDCCTSASRILRTQLGSGLAPRTPFTPGAMACCFEVPCAVTIRPLPRGKATSPNSGAPRAPTCGEPALVSSGYCRAIFASDAQSYKLLSKHGCSFAHQQRRAPVRQPGESREAVAALTHRRTGRLERGRVQRR